MLVVLKVQVQPNRAFSAGIPAVHAACAVLDVPDVLDVLARVKMP